MDAAIENQLSRASHVDVVVRLPPLDVQGAARQVNAAAAVNLALQHASHNSGAGTSATGQGATSTALPHNHADVRPGQDLNELGVGLGREDDVLLALGTNVEQVNLINLIK